jgi:hypothetical protein
MASKVVPSAANCRSTSTCRCGSKLTTPQTGAPEPPPTFSRISRW